MVKQSKSQYLNTDWLISNETEWNQMKQLYILVNFLYKNEKKRKKIM